VELGEFRGFSLAMSLENQLLKEELILALQNNFMKVFK